MWWKLTFLGIVTAGLIFSLIPIRTHAVMIDPASPPPPTRWTLRFIVSNMYLTPGTLIVICLVLAAAGYITLRIVRSA
ncbi:hypothetical protein TS85_22120 [Sphingomonas hengshuiensis]|uniref:Uncharacterized protein n=1 Tax=Sphingomonas hengshuiensis TaxID=1609977 RepID=A0A7U4LGT7_9SPHN|nr:hypothetical protein TS85_22120 [Sphingomonas hengshuiensis]